MKRVIIVHGWEGYPEYCWYPAVKKELEDKGFQVEIPLMPETKLPKMNKWVAKLAEVVSRSNQDTYLIGHSLGTVTILRYLEELKENQSVGGVILVAGFTDSLGYEELANFFTTPLNLEKIKTKASHFVAIHSDNDPFVDLKYGEEFKSKLGTKLIIKHQMGHFSGEVDDETSCTDLPDVTQEILEISK